MGSIDDDDVFLRIVSRAVNIVIVAVEYRLAPAHAFPAGLDDCVEAYRWAVANAAGLGTEVGKGVMVGTSAGGNLALAAALRVCDEGGGETLKGVVAAAPITVSRGAVTEGMVGRYTSYEECGGFSINPGEVMDMFLGELGPCTALGGRMWC